MMCACREELEKQRSAKAYQKLHQAGLTDEARSDLARLALIRQQREEVARKREEKIKGAGKYCNVLSITLILLYTAEK